MNGDLAMTDVAPDEVPTDAGSPPVSRFRSMSGILLILTILAVSSGVLAYAYLRNEHEYSPFDEWVYLDYVDKVDHLGLPQQGEHVDDAALEILSCRGVYVWGTMGSPCGGPYDPAVYPQGGVTAADIHPPTYFALTAVTAGALRAVGLSHDLLTSARVTGALWLFAGLAATVWLACELGARRRAALGAALLLASLPLTRLMNMYITPDAFNLLIGALTLLAAVKYWRREWSIWIVVAAGAFAGFVKAQDMLAVAVAALFLVAQAVVTDERRRRRPLVLAAVGITAGYIVAQVAWLSIRAIAAVGDPPEQPGAAVPLTRTLLVDQTTAFVFRLGLGELVPSPAYAYFAAALLVAGTIGAVLYRSVKDPIWAIGVAVTTMVFVGAPLLMIPQYLINGEVPVTPVRYGASLLAGMGVLVATAFASKARANCLLAIGVACFVIAALQGAPWVPAA